MQTKPNLENFVVSENGCWEWQGSKSRGYGKLTFNKKVLWAHRAAWIEKFGDISKGMCVCHKCDNKACINPDHLFLGSQKDNIRDAAKKDRLDRKLTHCPKGHLYEESNVYLSRGKYKVCKICRNESKKKYRASKK